MGVSSEEVIFRVHLLSTFAKMLLVHSPSRSCWYNVQFTPKSDRNLSTYLGLNNDYYNRLLIETGLAREMKSGGKTTIVVKDEKWKELQNLEHIARNNFEICKRRWKEMKNMMWVRLGRKMGMHDNYHAGNQSSDVKIQSFEILERKHLRSSEQISMVSEVKFILDKFDQLRIDQREMLKERMSRYMKMQWRELVWTRRKLILMNRNILISPKLSSKLTKEP